LSIQYKYIKKNPEYFLISSASEIIYEDDSPTWNNCDENLTSIYEIDESILIENPINHSSIIMKKKELINLGKYDEERASQFDYELWLRAFNNNKKMGSINCQLVAKRIHKNQSYENKKRLIYLYRSMNLQIKYIILHRKSKYLVIPPIRLIFGLLPFKLRKKIHRYIGR